MLQNTLLRWWHSYDSHFIERESRELIQRAEAGHPDVYLKEPDIALALRMEIRFGRFDTYETITYILQKVWQAISRRGSCKPLVAEDILVQLDMHYHPVAREILRAPAISLQAALDQRWITHLTWYLMVR